VTEGALRERLLRPLRSLLGRNALLNLLGFGAPLLVAALVLPVLVHALGPARFGLLGMAWAFLDYLTLFDVGLGKATVRFVADSLARAADDVSQITSVSVSVQLAVGAAAGMALALAAPELAGSAFRIEGPLRGEATRLFMVIGLNLPIVLALTTLRGVLEGAQRFTVSTALKIPSASGSVIICAVLARAGHSLPDMLLWVAAWRLLMVAFTLVAIRRALPSFRMEPPRHWRRLRPLIGFGGWVAVSGVVSPMLIYFDRFALSARAGLAAVGYYTAPFEGMTRALMIPNSLINAMFPLLTSLGVIAAAPRINRLFASSLRVLTGVMLIPTTIAFAFAPVILRVWMGPEYAVQGALALRILAVGVLINSIAHVPYTFLEAAGRPDIPAKFHALEIVFYLPFAWWLVGRFGIPGAALAWTTRVAVDTILLFTAVGRVTGVRVRDALVLPSPAAARPAA